MSVIGRLDEQVDEIIIKPVSRRRRDEDDAPAPPRPPEQPQPPPDPTPQNSSRDESTRGPDELPVWLL